MADPRKGRHFAPPPDHVEFGIPVAVGLAVLAVGAAIAGALSGAEPTGARALDMLWCAGFSAGLVFAASRSRRLPMIVLAGVAGVVGVGGNPVAITFGVLSLASASFLAFSRTRDRLVGGLVGLVAGQALLRGTSFGFVGLPTLVATVAVVPVLISAWRIARTRERRIAKGAMIGLAAVVLFGAATAGVAAYESRRHLQSAADLVDSGLDQLRGGDTSAADDAFSKARYQFERASSQLDGPFGLVGRTVPALAQNLNAIRRVSASGEDLSFRASQAAATADWRGITASGSQVDLAKMRDMQGPVTASVDALDAAMATVADVRSPWLLPQVSNELDRLDAKISGAAREASIAEDALDVAPALLGGDGPRRYFVAFATPGESRNAGGFVGAYAIIEANDGHLTLERTGTTQPGLAIDPAKLQLSEEWKDRYSSYMVAQFPGNMSASPDWPTDANVAAQIYQQSRNGAPVDGVIYADPTALAALLRLTGPIEVAGVPEPLTSMNVEQFLFVDQYQQYQGDANDERKDVLGEVAKSVFDALTSRPLPGIGALADALGPVVAGGHLRVTTFPNDAPVNRDAQAFLDRVGLSGRFAPTPGGDYLSLRSSNLAPTKIDAFLWRNVVTTITVDPTTGAVRTVVEAQLTNDAPSSGLPNYLLGPGTVVPRGTNRDLLSLYTPLNLSEITVDGMAVGVQKQTELGGNVYAVAVDIPAGGRVTVRYVLDGPPPASILVDGTYVLDVLPQPLARPDQWTVRVSVGDRDSGEFSGPLTEPLKLEARVVDRAG